MKAGIRTWHKLSELWLLWLIFLPPNPVTAWISSSSSQRTIPATTTTRTRLVQAASSTTPQQSSSASRSVANLETWATDVAGIRINPNLQLTRDAVTGYGWTARQAIPAGANQVLLQVPTDVALTVSNPGDGPDDDRVVRRCPDRPAFRKELPWYAQFAAYLHVLKTSDDDNMQPWLDSLPRSLETPIHWPKDEIEELQYQFMIKAVTRQRHAWRDHHKALQANGFADLSWEDFVWGCEIARSRAFSGAYTGGAFNPGIYAFTLTLVAVYVGLGLGTLEQAANGAGVVFCATVLKDFVLPKFFKTKKYVICPLIDMANHRSVGAAGDVSFEYFANAYSLTTTTTASVGAGEAVCISYGARSNDQWLQYYGFVEADDPHDVYIMPPLREWPIADMEAAAGRAVAVGRLQTLERAGLLGYTDDNNSSSSGNGDDDSKQQVFDENAANADGGVVVTRSVGLDPAVWQALRALFCTEAEWQAAGQAVGSFAESSPSTATDAAVRQAAKCALEWELNRKSTSLEQDVALQQRQSKSRAVDVSTAETLALAFRIEKKKLLQECLRSFA